MIIELSILCWVGSFFYKDTFKVVSNKYLITNPCHILIYVCDSVDRKAHLRDRKFSQWYSNYNSCNHHKLFKFKYDIELDDGVLEYYTSAALDENQYSVEFVQRIFTDYTKELDDLKNLGVIKAIFKMSQKLKIDIVSDVVCPWCTIGYKRLEKSIKELSIED